jgi:hypothetical protein
MEERDAPGQDGRQDDVVAFLQVARREGLISGDLVTTLLNFHTRACTAAEHQSTVDSVDSTRAAQAPAAHPVFPPRPPAPIPVPETTLPAQPPPAAAGPPQQLTSPAPQPAPAFAPAVPKGRTRTEVWARFAKMRSKKLWGTFTADFAANAFTYLGALLSIVVIYVFFAFGYFGETIDDEHKYFRPLVEFGVVAFFLGLAWLLRHRTGIPQTSTAIEMIGVVLVPIMLSASFRDGCTPAYRAWCMPPDVDGPARWAAYAGAGLISAGIYHVYARRRNIYAYLIAPMLWTSVGAFALYLEDGIPLLRRGTGLGVDEFTRDGISGPQLIAVLVAIGVTLTVATRVRETRLGQLLAVPTVRAGVFVTPIVLVLSLVFSYNDALSRGVIAPDLTDLAWPNFFAATIAAFVFAMASNAAFAWDSFGERLRRDMALVLKVAAYLSLAAAWLLTAGFGVTPAWLGAGLIGYSIVVALIDRFFSGPRIAAIWIVRTAGLVGGALALMEPGPALAAWGTLGALGIARSASLEIAAHVNRFVPEPKLPIDRQVAVWIPLLVAVGAGAARLSWPEPTPLVLLGAGTVFAATRLLPSRFSDIRTFAGMPAILAGIGALGVEIWRQLEGIGFEPYAFSGFLVALAILAALAEMPAPARIGVIAGLVGAAAMISLRHYIGNGSWDTAWIDTSVLAVLGLALVAVALTQDRHLLFYGALGHLLVVAAAGRSLVFEETALLGLSVLAVAHIAEAVSIEAGRSGVFARIAEEAGPGAEAVRSIPTVVALVALAPIAVLAGRKVPFIADERPRFGAVLAGLSWLYLAGAAQHLTRARRIAVPFAYSAALAAVAVSAPSIMAALLTTLSAAAVTALLAIRANRPYVTLLSWALAVAAMLLIATRMGVAHTDLYRVLHAAAAWLVLIPALLSQLRRGHVGLASPWLHPPVIVGTLLLPAALALALADGGWVAAIAISSAVTYGYLGWATRAGGVSIPAATAVAIAYASILYDNDWAHPFDDPLVWMPMATIFIGVAAVLPGSRNWRVLTDPAPGLIIAGLAAGALSAIYSQPAGVLDAALLGVAALLAGVYVIQRHGLWLVAAGVTLVVAGLVAGGYWAPAATFAVTLVTGFFADKTRGSTIATSLQAATTFGLAATFALVGVWRDSTAAENALIAGLGASLIVPLAGVFTVATSWPQRARQWTLPVHAIGHGLAVASVAAATIDLSPTEPYGVATLMVLLEAVVFAAIGTVRLRLDAVLASTALTAATYALFAAWQGWDAVELITFTAIIGGALLFLSAAGDLARSLPQRIQLWHEPILWLSQASAATVVVAAVAALGERDAAGVAVAVAGFEAVVVGTVGTIKRDQLRVVAAAVLAATSYALVPGWLGWSRADFAIATGIAATLLAIGATVATRFQSASERLRLWTLPLHAAAVGAGVAIAVKVVGPWPAWQQLWVIAAVLFGLGIHVTINAWAAPPRWQMRAGAAGTYLASAGAVIAAETARDGAVFTATLVVAGLGLVTAAIAGMMADTERPWHLELAGLSFGLAGIGLAGTVAYFGPVGVETGTLLLIVGAALAAYGLLAHNLAVIEAAMVMWLLALMILVNQQMELTLHAAVIISSITLLATLELERHRRHLAEEPTPSGLHHLEWVLMLGPLALATADMFHSLWYGLALFTEGLLVAGWGALTEMRRRALLGVAAMVAAIIMSAVIPALHGMNAGLTGGTWLLIGAISATLFIIAGSTIERQRHAIGRRLAHIAEILEDWE